MLQNHLKTLTREDCLHILPPDLAFNRKPYLHQLQGLVWASLRKNPALFLEMGCGKTACTIYWLKYNLIKEGILVVTVNFPLAHNWVREFRIEYPELKGAVLEGTREQRIELLKQNFNFYIINYEGLKVIFDELRGRHWNALVLDESRKIKSLSALRTKICIDLGKNIPCKAILSGLPIVKPIDIFSQFLFLDGGVAFGDNFWKFRNYYMEDLEKVKLIMKMLETYPDSAIARIARASPKLILHLRTKTGINYNPAKKKVYIRKFMTHIQKWVLKEDRKQEYLDIIDENSFQITKAEALDLPDKIKQQLTLHLSYEQQRDYAKLMSMEGDLSLTTLTQKQLESRLIKYSQIAGGFIKDKQGEYHFYKHNPKLDLLSDLIEEGIESSKIVIFHRFIAEGRMIEQRVKELGYKSASMRSEIKNTTAEYHRFLEDEDTRVLIAHPLSGGIGIDLINSNMCVFYSMEWSPEGKLQAEDRLHRIGQIRKVHYFYLTAINTIDETVWEAQEEGLSFIESLVRHRKIRLRDIVKGGGFRYG